MREWGGRKEQDASLAPYKGHSGGGGSDKAFRPLLPYSQCFLVLLCNWRAGCIVLVS